MPILEELHTVLSRWQ